MRSSHRPTGCGITDSKLADELERFAEDGGTALDAGLLVARVIDARAEVDWAREEVDRLAASVGVADAPAVVTALSDVGFQGASSYYELENSALDRVLRSRRGIPISLGVVVMGVGDALGLETAGINFPQHFLIRVGQTLIDPFRMAVTDEASCRSWLEQNRVRVDDPFAVAGPSDIALRMLNNVRMLAAARNDHLRALEFSDYQLCLRPSMYGLYVDRAETWRALGATDMVAQELRKALDLVDDAALRDQLLARLQRIRLDPPTLH